MEFKITLQPNTELDVSDLEFELGTVETIEIVQNITQLNKTEFLISIQTSYPEYTVEENILLLPQVRTVNMDL